MSFLKPDLNITVEPDSLYLSQHFGEIESFKYCIEISLEEYNTEFFNNDKYNWVNVGYENHIEHVLNYFFGSFDNFVNLYKKEISEKHKYYIEKVGKQFILSKIKIHLETNELTRRKRINFVIMPSRIMFTDPELDRAGDIETLLKQRKLQKNIQGF